MGLFKKKDLVIKELEEDIYNLRCRVYALENPPKYKVGQEVTWDNSGRACGGSSGTGTIVEIDRTFTRSSLIIYKVFNGKNIYDAYESNIKT